MRMNRFKKWRTLFFVLFYLTVVKLKAAQAEMALMPYPQEVKWTKSEFALNRPLTIVVEDSLQLRHELTLLAQLLASHGVHARLARSAVSEPHLELRLGTVEAPINSEEAYELEVTGNNVRIEANQIKGIFYAIQTFRQLITDKGTVPTCKIKDWPAFAWRGYLVDVGRNYQTMELLKKQLDVMAAYKMNIFHFHFTEDIAWRLASEAFPALTDATNMLRWPGNYYTEAEFRELIAYANERHITLVPEIDMPGHSGAFERALGVNMQSARGMQYIKRLLTEFCANYELPYIHIGGDEVKITNPNFLPEMIGFLDSLGKQTIGWEPGGNLPQQTIRQLWMGGPQPVADTAAARYIDSKHLYINHMDPLESVTTLFFRRIGEQVQGSDQLLGGTLCSWPDRAVGKETDVLLQNAVYPALLTFAERSWRGGGTPGWRCNIGNITTAEGHAFASFEDRLLTHKERYFKNLPFPYVKQSDVIWQFYGPYENDGNSEARFAPEMDKGYDHQKAAFEAVGGTLILRHWWADILQGLVPDPQEQTTWYARTKVWSDQDQTRAFWIGFNDLSRSYASDSPASNTWDDRGSCLWVNHQLIEPPRWIQAGMKGDLEKPLRDEGYTFREPTRIYLKKGWNEVLVKLPVNRFKGKDWQNPVKWMFTFVPL